MKFLKWQIRKEMMNMKLGILGTGMIVKDLLTTFHKLTFEKVMILAVPQAEEEAKSLCKTYGLDGYVFDYDKLLQSDIDTIYVALPNHLHFSFAKKALEHKKNVIIEKPITANNMELKILNELAKEQGCIMLEAMNIHHLPAYKELINHLKEVGNVKIVSFNYSQYSSRFQAFQQGTILPVFDYHKAGGALMDLNVYNIHGIVGLFGRPKHIFYRANIERGIDTSGILTLEYENFQVVSIGAKDCKAPVMCTIQGDEGVLRMDVPINQLIEFSYQNNVGEEKFIKTDHMQHRLFYEFEEFIRIIEEKDMQKADEYMQISLIVSDIMYEARSQTGIIFDNDAI